MNKILSFLILIIQICFSLNANSQKVDLSSYSYLRLFENEIICPESNVKFRNFDFEAIKWIEKNFSYSEDEIIAFSTKELLRI